MINNDKHHNTCYDVYNILFNYDKIDINKSVHLYIMRVYVTYEYNKNVLNHRIQKTVKFMVEIIQYFKFSIIYGAFNISLCRK